MQKDKKLSIEEQLAGVVEPSTQYGRMVVQRFGLIQKKFFTRRK